jgi:hypothetical protein
MVALSRDPDAFLASAPTWRGPGIRWITGSVATLEAGKPSAGRGFDMVIHLATEADMQAHPGTRPARRRGHHGGNPARPRGGGPARAPAGSCSRARAPSTAPAAGHGAHFRGLSRGARSHRRPAAPYALPGEAKRQAELLCESARGTASAPSSRAASHLPGRPSRRLKFAFGNFMGDALQPEARSSSRATARTFARTSMPRTLPSGSGRSSCAVRRAVRTTWARSTPSASSARRGHRGGTRVAKGIEVSQAAQRPGAAPDRYVPSTERARREELGLREQVQPAGDHHQADGVLAPGRGAALTLF